MLEPLSDPIRKLILELRLCSERDLRSCRRLVRRLTRDLPAFDSVWLDALVQIGRLTPYQARFLESGRPENIRIGPCVVVNRIGAGPNGETLLARPRDGGELCVMKILRAAEHLSDESVERLETLVQKVRGLDHPCVVAPRSCVRAENRVILISRYVPGPHLGELLVRRGRFPGEVVWEMGRQLAEGLEALSQRTGRVNGTLLNCTGSASFAGQIVHGDIRAANVRLTTGGVAVLVDAGIGAVIGPGLTIHSGLPPERCDGIAPELIGGIVTPNTASDAYALGCLLWQLLAGRPPFPAGDPLVKLAAHQTRTIDDVRKWAPDAPAALAEGIRRLTARNPSARPAFSEILEIWGPPGRSGRRLLAGFRRRFDAPAGAVSGKPRLSIVGQWLLLLAILFAAFVAAATLSNKGARNVVLAWAAHFSQALRREHAGRDESPGLHPPGNDTERPGSANAAAVSTGRPLPAPDPSGVIHLDAAGPYRASEITVVGELTISAADGAIAEIVIDERPLKLWAESVRIKNVRMTTAAGSSGLMFRLSALLVVQAQSLLIEGCVVDSGTIPETPERNPNGVATLPPAGPAAIAWKLLDLAEAHGAAAAIRNSVVLGSGPALYLAQAAGQVEFGNVLRIGSGPLVQLAAVPAAKSGLELRLTHTTLRDSGALLRWLVPAEGAPLGRVLVEAADCVFDVDSPRAALIELAGHEPRPNWLHSVRMTGEGSLAGPRLDVAAWVSTAVGSLSPFDGSDVEVEGLVAGPFRFTGDAGANPSASEVEESEAPRRSSDPPGIRARDLPDGMP